MKTQLFKGYNRIIYIASAVVFLITMVLVILQFNALFTHEEDQINNHFEHSLSKLTQITGTAVEHLNSLRTDSEVYLNNPLLQVPHPLFSYLQENKKEDYFHLDSLPLGFASSETGNLTGLGSLKNLADSSKLAINMALYLNPLFKSSIQRIPNINLAYLLRHDFYHTYPFILSKNFRLTPEIEKVLRTYEQPVMSSQNPTKKEIWTKIYADFAGQGMMVSALMPIYKKEQYAGLLGFDLTLDSLNSVISTEQRHIGDFFVVNSHNQVLAHPHFVSSKDTVIRMLDEILPVFFDDLQIRTEKDLERYAPAKLHEINDSYLYYNSVAYSDWKMVYIVHKSDLYRSILKEAGLRLLFVLANVILVLVLTFYLTQKRFIKPAQQLVDLIQYENSGKKFTLNQIPKDWQASFDIILHIFTKNREMIQELQKDNSVLEEKVKKRTKILEKRNKEILEQQQMIEAKNLFLKQINDDLLSNEQQLKMALLSIEVQKEKITDGMRYAQTIQEAILPPDETIKAFLRDFFVIYKPKDIVSGDLYWAAHLDNKIFIIVIDCTGHGVSGAFMSMITYSLLNQIVHEKHIFEPDQILQHLNDYMLKIFHSNNNNNDGLAIGICQIRFGEDSQQIHFTYANAKMPCYYVLNNELQTIKRENHVIGGIYKNPKNYTQTHLLLDRKTIFYIFTDGYGDQSNSEHQRIGSEKVKELILTYFDYPLSEQKQLFESFLKEYQQDEEQRDDISIFGFKV